MGRQGASRAQRLMRLAALGLAGYAIVQELRKPPSERTWHGTVAGFVPYDFRLPTRERLEERTWAPDNPRLIMPQVFGVGWTLNVGRIVALVRRRVRGTR